MNSNSIKSKILDFFIKKSNSIFFRMKDSYIIETNNFTNEYFGKDITNKKISDLTCKFSDSHDFDKYIKDENDEIKHLINLTPINSDTPHTFEFFFFKHNQEILAIGQDNWDERHKLDKEIPALYSKIAESNRELSKNTIQLKKLNEQKNKFLSMAAHDLRSPLSGIISFSTLLSSDDSYELSDESLEVINQITKTSTLMLNIIEDLLDYSVIESSVNKLILTQVNIEDLLKECRNCNLTQANNKGVMLEFINKTTDLTWSLNYTSMVQVLNNLVSNAIKFSHSNTSTTLTIEQENNDLIFEVKDQGQGIKKDEIGLLFDPLEKISTSPTNGEKSTRLGLCITKQLIESHKGSLLVRSDYGKGTVITVKIPNQSI